MMKKKKKLMRVGLSGRNVTYNGNYNLHYGTDKSSYNKLRKSFKSRGAAVAYKNALIKRKKKNYKVRYMYLAD